MRQQHHQIDHVDHPDPQPRDPLAQQMRGGQDLLGRHVSGRGQYDVRALPRRDRCRILWKSAAHPRFDAPALTAATRRSRVRNGRMACCRQPHRAMIAGKQWSATDNRVFESAAAETRRPRGQRDHRIDLARTLMAETVVVVAPTSTGQQHVQRGDGFTPGNAAACRSHLACCTSIDTLTIAECLMRREQSVTSGEEVPSSQP